MRPWRGPVGSLKHAKVSTDRGCGLLIPLDATAAALSTMLAPSKASNARCCNDQGIDVADADNHPHRTDVGAIYPGSRDGSRSHGSHGQSLAARQAPVGLGAAVVFRAHQCG